MKKIILFILFSFMFFIYAEKKIFPIKGLLTVGESPILLEYEFDRNWFNQTSFEYNHKIAKLACILSEVSYVDAKKENNELLRIYKEIGVKDEDIFLNYEIDYTNSIGNNQAAYSFAIKDDLIFIVIRGTPLSANEWISNLNISDSKKDEVVFHEGFRVSTEEIYFNFENFLKEHKIETKKTKLLITGHSRGAAIANLFSVNLVTEKQFCTKNIFAYTFATPNVTIAKNAHAEKFGYIWNIESEEDLVQSVPPERNNWKFKKFGKVKTFVNRYQTSEEKFNEFYYPKMNFYFKQFLNRDYEPFKTGSFIPIQFARIFSKLENNITDYYGFLGLRKSEFFIWKVFDNEKTKDLNKISKKEKKEFLEQIEKSFTDMHACETYLSWLFAFDENEAFSEIGSNEIVFYGSQNCAVYNSKDELLLKIVEGRTKYKSIKRPIIAYTILGNTVLGFPSTENFSIYFKKDCLIPTPIKIKLEHYDNDGILQSDSKEKFYLHNGITYKIETEKLSLAEEKINVKKVKDKKEKKEKTKPLRNGLRFYLAPELNFSTKKDLTFGLNVGIRSLYAIAKFTPNCFIDDKILSVGVGTQFNLFWRFFLNSGFLWNFNLDENNDLSKTIFVSLAYQPFTDFQFFGGIEFLDKTKFRFGIKF